MVQVVYMAIAWLSMVVVLFMVLILYITKVEINNSKRALALRLIMHYSHRYFRMRVAFEQNNVFNKQASTADEMKDLYKKYGRTIQENIPSLSGVINQSCVNNQFFFIKDITLRSILTIKAKEIIEAYQMILRKYQYFEDNILGPLSDEDVEALWDDMAFEYQGLVQNIIESHELLSNDSYVGIVK